MCAPKVYIRNTDLVCTKGSGSQHVYFFIIKLIKHFGEIINNNVNDNNSDIDDDESNADNHKDTSNWINNRSNDSDDQL